MGVARRHGQGTAFRQDNQDILVAADAHGSGWYSPAGGDDPFPRWRQQAAANVMTRTGPDGSQFTLTGNARLVCVRLGKRVEVATERIRFNLLSGHVECDLGAAPCVPQTPSVVPCSAPR